MEMLLAHARIYLMVIVFFATCFLGLMAEVSFPILAIRSVAITSIVGIVSHLFVKYIISVTKTVPLSSEEPTTVNNPVPPVAGGVKNSKKT